MGRMLEHEMEALDFDIGFARRGKSKALFISYH